MIVFLLVERIGARQARFASQFALATPCPPQPRSDPNQFPEGVGTAP